MADSFDVIVIGGGPGGYVAAIRAAQLGKKTAVVEKDKSGGRCLNYACIPAKTMLHTADLYDDARQGEKLGVKVEGISLDWDALGERRANVSKTLSGGVEMLWKKNKITQISGEASLDSDANVVVDGETYEAANVILATGSVAMPIPGVEFGGRVVDTWGAWSFDQRPESIAIVGAGASGSEIASAYARFGTEVTLIEMADQILPLEDVDVAKVVNRAFKKQGIDIRTGTKVENVEAGSDSVKVELGDDTLEVDYLAIAGGRKPDVDALKLGDAGIELTDNGRVRVDEWCRTTNEKVFAIGDLVRGPALAHKASEEGSIVAELIAGAETEPLDLRIVPGATFCHPQVASVGMTEAEAKEAGNDVKVGRFKLGGAGASAVYDDREGIIKVVADSEFGEILGAHIVGNIACDMISEFVDVIALEGGHQELARIIHPHPTMSEAVLDAARAVDGWAIHA